MISRLASLPAAAIIAIAVAAAVLLNLVVTGVARALGGTFLFTSPTWPALVDQLTVGGFSAVPLAVGLTVAALLGMLWPRILVVAMIVAPVLELGSILGMTVPADFDPTSKLGLALCHVVLVPVSLIALAALQRRALARAAGKAVRQTPVAMSRGGAA